VDGLLGTHTAFGSEWVSVASHYKRALQKHDLTRPSMSEAVIRT
jgi:hypothetical protein